MIIAAWLARRPSKRLVCGLAVDHGGSLVTLDRLLRADLVAGGTAALMALTDD